MGIGFNDKQRIILKQSNDENVGTTSGALDVSIQDATTHPFQYYLMREDKTDITLTQPTVIGSFIVNVSPGHGFTSPTAVTGNHWIVITENDVHIQSKVRGVTGNTILIQSLIPFVFSTSATVIRGVIDMNVNASSADQYFRLKIRNSTSPIDIQYAHICIWNDNSAGDDGKFGDLTELTNGLGIMKISNLLNATLGNFLSNSDFSNLGADLIYNERAGGGGTYGISARFNIKDIYGVVLRLDSRISEEIRCLVRDDLSTLKRLRISLMGQITSGE